MLLLQFDYERQHTLDHFDAATVALAESDPKKLLSMLVGPQTLAATADQKILLIMRALKFNSAHFPTKIVNSFKKLNLPKNEKSLLATFVLWNIDQFPKIQCDKLMAKLVECITKKHVQAIYEAGIPKERFIQMGRVSAQLLKHTKEWSLCLETNAHFKPGERGILKSDMATLVLNSKIRSHGNC